MQAAVVVCLSVCALYGVEVLGQVGSLCRPNERLLVCGCPKTCKDPVPDCRGVCRMGCYCEEGQVRNATGHCVKLADCPPMEAYKLDTTEPRADGGQCPEHEEYRFCEPCSRTCDQPNPRCPAQCGRGCFCKDGLLRDRDNRCVLPEKCSNSLNALSYQLTCNEHQVYKRCETCEKTCSDPNPTCPKPCMTGCFCEESMVKAPDGKCVKLDKCPRAEVTIGEAHDPSVEDCAPDEEYFSCGWCEPSCSEPRPSCPGKVCTRGCLCKPPLVRHHSGHCVEAKDCTSQRCPNSNEEYVCRYGCEPRCDGRPCATRARRCTLGCHCRLGLLRDSATGHCVTRDKCSNTTAKILDTITNFAVQTIRRISYDPRYIDFERY